MPNARNINFRNSALEIHRAQQGGKYYFQFTGVFESLQLLEPPLRQSQVHIQKQYGIESGECRVPPRVIPALGGGTREKARTMTRCTLL